MTILLLEDESCVMRLLWHMLKPHTLLEATSAEQALRLFSEHYGGIDLLIADVTLPVGTGIQVALSLRTQSPSLPVVLTSGYPVSAMSGQNIADLHRLGTDRIIFVTKPFQPGLLEKAVRELIETSPSHRTSAA